MAAIIARELLHLAVYLAGAFATYYIVLSLLRRNERQSQMTDLQPPEPTSQGPNDVIGRILGGLILTAAGAAIVSALATLTIVIWRWAL